MGTYLLVVESGIIAPLGLGIAVLIFIALIITYNRPVFHDIRRNISLVLMLLLAVSVPIMTIFKTLIMPLGISEQDLNNMSISFVTMIMGSIIIIAMKLLWILEDKREHLQINNHWSSDSIMDQLKLAKNEINLLQTWFPDAARLADVISTTFDKNTKHLSVNIYLFHPHSIVGAQRFLEINSENLDESQDDEITNNSGFVCQVIASLDNFIQRFEKTNHLHVKIFLHNKMPKQKIYLIDDIILYSSFPAGKGSTSSKPSLLNRKSLTQPKNESIVSDCKASFLEIANLGTTSLYYEKKIHEKGKFHQGRYFLESEIHPLLERKV